MNLRATLQMERPAISHHIQITMRIRSACAFNSHNPHRSGIMRDSIRYIDAMCNLASLLWSSTKQEMRAEQRRQTAANLQLPEKTHPNTWPKRQKSWNAGPCFKACSAATEASLQYETAPPQLLLSAPPQLPASATASMGEAPAKICYFMRSACEDCNCSEGAGHDIHIPAFC